MPIFRKVPQRANTIPITTPSPYKGLNTIDSLAAMDPAFGLSIQNFVASPQGLSLRQGFVKYATELPAPTTSLLIYNGRVNTSSKLFAVCADEIYDVSGGGDMSAATPVATGLSSSNAYWQYAQQTYGTGLNNYLIAVNGFDAPIMWDGSGPTFTTCTQVAVPAAAGQFATVDNNGAAVNMAEFKDVILHNQRLWFVQNNSTRALYCNIGSVGGAFFAFDFASYFKRGGHLHKLASWTIDTGNGQASLLVAFSNKGDVVIYQGDDPSDPATFDQIGDYQLGSPVGLRSTLQMEGDLLNLTQDGLYPMSKYMQSARLDATSALTYNISNVISALVSTFANQPGFEMALLPKENLLFLNIPQADQANNFQFVMNTITKGWTQFTGWPAQCFGLFNDQLYFGGTNYVALTNYGHIDGADILGAGGDNIIGTALTAFTSMTETGLGPGMLKHAKLVMPYIITGQSSPTVRIGVNTDFNMVPIIGSATINPITGAVWDGAVWDSGATWVGSLITHNQWSTPTSWPGAYLALSISISANSDALWSATNWMVAPSGSQFG